VELAQQVGMNIRVLRVRRRLSQEKLAERMGIERQQVSDIELGKRNLTLLTVTRICQALNCQPSELFADTSIELSQGKRSR